MKNIHTIPICVFFFLLISCSSHEAEKSDQRSSAQSQMGGEINIGNSNDVPSIPMGEIASVERNANNGDADSLNRLYMHFLTNNNPEQAGKWALIGARQGDCESISNLVKAHFGGAYKVDAGVIRTYIKKYRCKEAWDLYKEEELGSRRISAKPKSH